MTQEIPGSEIRFDLVFLPGGSFQLGSTPDEPGRDDDEGPVRSVSVSGFWMSVTEIPEEVFALFRDRRLDTEAAAPQAMPFDVDAVSRPSPPYEDPMHGMGGPKRPATGMTRLAALRFARWLSEKTGRLYRLPTEAEWEYACRSGGDGPHGLPSGAADLEDYAWYAHNAGGGLHDVGGRLANDLGLHDLIGNAAEWTLDPYQPDFYAALESHVVDPSPGSSSRGRGVVRGGAFDDEVAALRCADRFQETALWKRRDPQIPRSRWWNTDAPHVGFRVITPAQPASMDEIRRYWNDLLNND